MNIEDLGKLNSSSQHWGCEPVNPVTLTRQGNSTYQRLTLTPPTTDPWFPWYKGWNMVEWGLVWLARPHPFQNSNILTLTSLGRKSPDSPPPYPHLLPVHTHGHGKIWLYLVPENTPSCGLNLPAHDQTHDLCCSWVCWLVPGGVGIHCRLLGGKLTGLKRHFGSSVSELDSWKEVRRYCGDSPFPR